MKITKLILHITCPIVFLLVLPAFALLLVKRPSHNRNWEIGQEKLAKITFFGEVNEKVKIKNFRDFDWNADDVIKWTEKEVDIKNIVSVDVAVSHFSKTSAKYGVGHVFLIFNFSDGSDIGLSVEARRDNGEEFTILGGLKFDYEIAYIFASKNDLLNLRKKRNEKTYVYKTKIEAEKAKSLFISFANKTNSVYDKPKFYHLFFENCANSISKELKEENGRKFTFVETSFLPGLFGETMFEMGLVKTNNNNFEDVKEEFLVNNINLFK